VPGEPGVALLTSHLDTRTQGRGVFSGLTSLEVGATIGLRDSAGTATQWRVVAREQRLKTDLPPQLFARSGSPLLALVTCGGPFDQTVRSYRDNVIVWAELAS
jgi:sortase (surface protein transpeptidase)